MALADSIIAHFGWSTARWPSFATQSADFVAEVVDRRIVVRARFLLRRPAIIGSHWGRLF
jgi:hypothetical protein